MLVTVGKLSVDFCEDIEAMERKLQELERLENAIESSAQYKLLSGKTQMIGKGKGEIIKERSRRIHTTGIAKSVVLQTVRKIYDRFQQEHTVFSEDKKYRRIFELNRDIALTRGMIMAKAHDIGHVPEGHEGEKAINEFFSQIVSPEDIEAVLNEHLKIFGREYEKAQGHIEETDNTTELVDELFPPQVDKQLSFEHNELSAILLNQLIEEYQIELSDGQIDWDEEYDISADKNRERKSLTMGVLGHSTSRTPFELLEGDIVAQIVRVGDKVEYINADYDEIEGLIEGKFSVEQQSYLQKTRFDRMTDTVDKLVDEAFASGQIHDKGPAMLELRAIRRNYEDIIYLYDGIYADNLLKKLLTLSSNPEELRKFYDQNPGVEVIYPTETLELFVKYREALQQKTKGEGQITDTNLRNMYENILTQQLHFRGIIQGENSDRIALMYAKVLQYYYTHQEEIPDEVGRKVEPIDLVSQEKFSHTLRKDYSPLQRTLEYISVMDDKTFEETYENLVRMRIEQGPGYGIEPIHIDEIKLYLREVYDLEIEQYKNKISGTGSRTFAESKKLYTDKSREFFQNRLTPKGKAVLQKHYAERLLEYKRDQDLYREMQARDAEREPQTPVISTTQSLLEELRESGINATTLPVSAQARKNAAEGLVTYVSTKKQGSEEKGLPTDPGDEGNR